MRHGHAETSGGKSPARGSRVLALISFLAVWPTLYVLSCFGVVILLAAPGPLEGARIAAAGGFVAATAAAAYLLDRVKVRDAWLDPADAVGQGGRFAFIARHAAPLRLTVIILVCIGTALAGWLSPWLVAAPLLAVIGVWMYAGRPRRVHGRPKDLLYIKTLYTSAGITGFSLLVAFTAVNPRGLRAWVEEVGLHTMLWVIPGLALLVRVVADAVLCDIEDVESDRMHGTETVPVRWGTRRAWRIAMALRGVSVAVLLCAVQFPVLARVTWATTMCTSSIVLYGTRPAWLREWVDAGLAIECACLWAVCTWFGG